MATQTQLDSVRRLHEENKRTLNGYDQSKGQYNVSNGTLGGGDPYEAYHAMLEGGLLTPPPTVDTVTVNAGTPDYAELSFEGAGVTFTSTVTFNDAVGGEDETVTWSLTNNVSGYAIDANGVVTLAISTAGETFDVVATSNFDNTTIGTLSVTVVA